MRDASSFGEELSAPDQRSYVEDRMANRKLPDRDYLRQRLSYDEVSGTLTWLKRPPRDFSTKTQWKIWNTRFAHRPAGCVGHKDRGRQYYVVTIDYTTFVAHRVIYKMITGEEPEEIDHIDGNGLNNSWSNLREADSSQNKANRPGKAKSGFKGVSPNGNGWGARLQFRKRVFCLGTYTTPEEAYAAYCKAAAKIHGAFANYSQRETFD